MASRIVGVGRLLAALARSCLAGLRHVAKGTWQRAWWAARGVQIAPGVTLLGGKESIIELAKGVSIGRGALIIATTDGGLGTQATLRVGANSAINEYSNIRASGGTIEIGKNCLIAQFVSLVAVNHAIEPGLPIKDQPWAKDRTSIRIGDDVWLGAGVSVLPGVSIGKGVVVGAGAVVTRDIPDYEIWGGIPARRIGHRVPSTESRNDVAPLQEPALSME